MASPVDKSAETLGFRFEVRDPDDVWKFVGAIWLWALIRYWLFFYDYHDEEMTENVKRREYQAYRYMSAYRIRKIERIEGLNGRPRNSRPKIDVDLKADPNPGFDGKICFDSTYVTVVTGGNDTVGSVMPQSFGSIEIRRARAFAWVHLAITTRYGTEYFVPFALGFLPAAVVIWHHIVWLARL